LANFVDHAEIDPIAAHSGTAQAVRYVGGGNTGGLAPFHLGTADLLPVRFFALLGSSAGAENANSASMTDRPILRATQFIHPASRHRICLPREFSA